MREGAAAFIEALEASKKPWLLVTNDAARSPATAAAWYRSLGLPIPDVKVLTSSVLLSQWVLTETLRGQKCIILGPKDAQKILVDAGVVAVDADDDTAEAIAICDEDGYPFLPTIDAVVSWWIRRLDRGFSTPAVLANPDLIYPKGQGRYGIAAGSVAAMIEGALRVRHPQIPAPFTALGKPFAPIFDEAKRRLGPVAMDTPHAVVMVGDTLETDIRGGRDAGMMTALVDADGETPAISRDGLVVPTHRLSLRTGAAPR